MTAAADTCAIDWEFMAMIGFDKGRPAIITSLRPTVVVETMQDPWAKTLEWRLYRVDDARRIYGDQLSVPKNVEAE